MDPYPQAPPAPPGSEDCNSLWRQLQQLVQSREDRLSAREQEVQQQAQQHQHMRQLLVDLAQHIQSLTNRGQQIMTNSTAAAAVAQQPSEAVVLQFLQQMLQYTPRYLHDTSNINAQQIYRAAAAADTVMASPAASDQQQMGQTKQQQDEDELQQQQQQQELPFDGASIPVFTPHAAVNRADSSAAALQQEQQQQQSDVLDVLACSGEKKTMGKRQQQLLSQLLELSNSMRREQRQVERMQKRIAGDLQQAQQFAAFLLTDAESAERFQSWQQQQQQQVIGAVDRQWQQQQPEMLQCRVCGASLVQDAALKKKGTKKRKIPHQQQQDAQQQYQQQQKAEFNNQPSRKQKKLNRRVQGEHQQAQTAKTGKGAKRFKQHQQQREAAEETDNDAMEQAQQQQQQYDMLQHLQPDPQQQECMQLHAVGQIDSSAAAAACAGLVLEAENQQHVSSADIARDEAVTVPAATAAPVCASPAADDILGELYSQQEAEDGMYSEQQQQQHQQQHQQQYQQQNAETGVAENKSVAATAATDNPSAAFDGEEQPLHQQTCVVLGVAHEHQQQQQEGAGSPPARALSPPQAVAIGPSHRPRRITPTLVAPVEAEPAVTAAATATPATPTSADASTVLPADGLLSAVQCSSAVAGAAAEQGDAGPAAAAEEAAVAANSHCHTPQGKSPVKQSIFKPTVPRTRRPTAAAEGKPAAAATLADESQLVDNSKHAAVAAAACDGLESDVDDPELQAAAAAERGASPGVGLLADEKRRRQRNQYAGIFVRRFEHAETVSQPTAAAAAVVGVAPSVVPVMVDSNIQQDELAAADVPQQQQQQQQQQEGQKSELEIQQDGLQYDSVQQQQQQQIGMHSVHDQSDHLRAGQPNPQHESSLQQFSHFGQQLKQEKAHFQLAGKPWLLPMQQQQQDPLLGFTEGGDGKHTVMSSFPAAAGDGLGSNFAPHGQDYEQQHHKQQRRQPPVYRKASNQQQQQGRRDHTYTGLQRTQHEHQQHNKGRQQRHPHAHPYKSYPAKHAVHHPGGVAAAAVLPGSRRHYGQHGGHGSTAAAAPGGGVAAGRRGFGRRLEEDASEQELAEMVESLKKAHSSAPATAAAGEDE